jgi:hypothetical protein
MHELDRRSMLKVVAALSLGPYSALADEKDSTLHFVEAGTDRTGQPHKAARRFGISRHKPRVCELVASQLPSCP